MKLTRRQFNRAALGAGLTFTAGGLLFGCGDDDSAAPTPPAPAAGAEVNNFHNDR